MERNEVTQYYGLYINTDSGVRITSSTTYKKGLNPVYSTVDFLELPSPLDITNEHALHIKTISGIPSDILEKVLQRFIYDDTTPDDIHPIEYTAIIDLLRELGYATPWKTYSIEDLVDIGVLTILNNQ